MQEWCSTSTCARSRSSVSRSPGTGTPSCRRSRTTTTWCTRAPTPTERRCGSTSSFRVRWSAPGFGRNTRRAGMLSTPSGKRSRTLGKERCRQRFRRARHAIVTFCDLCQLVLCGGTPKYNTAETLVLDGKKYIFCSKPCRWIFEREPERYKNHKDVVKRVLAGEAPANLVALLTRYFGLSFETWGKDALGGNYPWMKRRSLP